MRRYIVYTNLDNFVLLRFLTIGLAIVSYSLDVNSLSRGEKTSVALAYRLALNTMTRKIADMDTSLLILDEPTDGFGKEQLIRLREVLDDLN
jgi:DNA repair protein SbcC/Rad50